MKARSPKWLLVAAVATLGLTSAPAWAQDVPQNPVIAEGTDYGNVFNPDLAASEAVHLTSLKLAIGRCDRGSYDAMSVMLWADYLSAKARYQNFLQQFRNAPQKIRTAIYGGGEIVARQKARLKHDMDEALKIYNERPPFKCAMTNPPATPPPPNAGGGTARLPETPPVIARAQGIADTGQQVLDRLQNCIPPALANSWISLLFSQELAVIKFSKANHTILETDPLVQRLEKLLKEFERRRCGKETPQHAGGRPVGGGFFERPESGTGGYPLVGGLPFVDYSGISLSGSVGYSNLTSVTKFSTTADTFKTTSTFSLVNLRTMMAAGRYYSSTEISFGGPATSGSFSDTFNAFPAANFSGNVTSGTAFLVTQDFGFNFIQMPGLKAGPFVGYHLFAETLGGSTAAFPAVEMPILNDRWQAARVGVGFDKTFLDGGSSISMSFVGMPFVQYQSGAFTADGWGLQGNAAITFPIPGLQPGFDVSVFARDTYMTVSGNTAGPLPVPMDVKNNNFTAGVRINLNFNNIPSGAPVRVP